jgi:hypothetical protein
MPDSALHILEGSTGIPFEPVTVKGLGHDPKLDDEVAGEVFGFGLTALLAPEPNQGCRVLTHDDPGIRPADKGTPIMGHSYAFRLKNDTIGTVSRGARRVNTFNTRLSVFGTFSDDKRARFALDHQRADSSRSGTSALEPRGFGSRFGHVRADDQTPRRRPRHFGGPQLDRYFAQTCSGVRRYRIHKRQRTWRAA